MDIIKSCDHLIDLGPEGGEEGGNLVFSGKTDEIVKNKKSITGKYLSSIL
ncbi:MAG: hypothetical protein HRT44_13035 [Bdellovibrionales bacterium]|nr:hypothetical protein [Bdellovibrionales bacterium]NQZ20162.1 hypothetical protein [Bdellovibrionales bacterium]